MQNFARKTVAEHFNRAAGDYDRAAPVQEQIAAHLVRRACECITGMPQAILDIGCGTGFVAEAASHQWPLAHISAIDGAPAMLNEAQRKLPRLKTMKGDIATFRPEPNFDLILSSMALHWSPDPVATLTGWQKGLRPEGKLFAALLLDGSFQEWRNLCAANDAADGLWPLPRADFASGIVAATGMQTIKIDYSSAKDFLVRLKAIGAAAPRPGHTPFDVSVMRRLLACAPTPFTITYRALYIEAPSVNSI